MIQKLILWLIKIGIGIFISKVLSHIYNDKERGERYIELDEIKDDLQKLYSIIKYSMSVTLVIFAFLISFDIFKPNTNQHIKYILYVGNVIAIFGIWKFVKNGKSQRKKTEEKRELIEKIIMSQIPPVYEYDGQFGRYFLREEFVTIRDLMYAWRWIVISSFLIIYDKDFFTAGGLAVCVYPIFVVIFSHEIYMYLSGFSKEEYCKVYYDREEKEIEEIPIVGLYDGLKEEVEEGELIKWGKRRNYIVYDESENGEDSNEREEYERELLMKYLEGKDYDSYKLKYLIEPTIAVLKKQNVVFRTFFYRDLDFALIFPMLQRILEGEKCLFVVDRNRREKEMQWMWKKMEELCGIYDFVRIKEMLEAQELDDIIVLGYNEIKQFADSKLFQRIADRLGTIFLLDPSGHTLQELEEIKKIKKFSEEMYGEPNIVIADSHRELADKMVFLEGDDTVCWGSYGMYPTQAIVVCWDADSVGEVERVILELRVIQALQNKMTSGEIIWIYGDKRAAVDIWWQFRHEKGEPDGGSVSLEKDGKQLELGKEAFFIIEDSEFNYNRVAEQYLTRADEKALLNIISPNYLLRDFMVSNQEDRNIREILIKRISPEPDGQEDKEKNRGYLDIFQKYLPGQYIVEDGMRYKITHIVEVKDEYVVQKVQDLDNRGSRIYYRQDRSYGLKNEEVRVVDTGRIIWQSEEIEMFLERAEITGRTYGYVEMPEFNNLYYAHKVELSLDIPERVYKNRQYIRWRLKGANVNVLAYFAAILKEMLYTLCPEFVDYISLCIVCHGEDRKIVQERLRGVVAEITGKDLKDEMSSVYLIEDNMCESGIVPAIAKRWNVIYRLMGMYVKWSIERKCKYLAYGNEDEIENVQEILENMKKYLTQDLREIKDKEESETRKEAELDEQKKTESFVVKSEKEAKRIFADILLDMFYFEEQHVNIPLRPVFGEKDKQKGEVSLRLGVDYRTFYWECAHGILLAYYQQVGNDKADEMSRDYAQKYVELIYSI